MDHAPTHRDPLPSTLQEEGAAASAPDWERVSAPDGVFLPRVQDGLVRALGIRYARSERFGAPTLFSSGPDPVDATVPAPACPQEHRPTDTALVDLGFDEHCQRLSVTRPATAETDLPVMIWLHGGSYTGGAGDLPHYDPSALVREHDVVVVSVTYRLGLFGYLGDGRSREANAGLLDQATAVEWVARNIEAFGGDPQNIILAGQSAGAHACFDLLMTDRVPQLVRRAILQSAPMGIVHGRRPGVWNALAPAASATASMLEATAEDLVAGEARINRLALRRGSAKFMPFSTRYGAVPLPPEAELRRRWRALAGSVDVLIGTTSREVALFLGAVPPLQRLAGTRWGRRAVAEPLVRLLTRAIYRRGNRRWAGRLRRVGGHAGLYEFGFGRSDRLLSGCHMAELPLLFPHPVWREGTEQVGAGVTGPQLMDSYDPTILEEAGRALRARWGAFLHGQDPQTLTDVSGVIAFRR